MKWIAAPALIVSIGVSMFSGPSTAWASSKASDFKSFAAQVRKGLAFCAAATADAQIQ
jgi:hypothetical protein